MPSICLYLQAHQPCRIKNISFFDFGNLPDLEDRPVNKYYLKQVLSNSYLPVIRMMKDHIGDYKGEFRFAVSITGTLMEQLRTLFPGMFLRLCKYLRNQHIEVITEPYYHSFASFYSPEEFKKQVFLQEEIIKKYLDKKSVVFRNAELAYRSDLANYIGQMNYRGIIIEGTRRMLNSRSPYHIYEEATHNNIRLLVREPIISQWFSNYKAPRNTTNTAEAKKLTDRISGMDGDLIVIGFDIENLGEHHHKYSGIFSFLKKFIKYVLKNPDLDFIHPSEALDKFKPAGSLEIYTPVTWHGNRKDLSAWTGNILQKEAVKYLYAVEEKIKQCRNDRLIDQWRKLQSTDHLLYLSDDETINGKKPGYFSPFQSCHDAYVAYINALASLEIYAEKVLSGQASPLFP